MTEERINEINGEIRALKLLLSESDYKAIKYSEGLIPYEDYLEVKLFRQSLRDKINELESELIKGE